ncbi:MAG: 6,7-dimethyl-8-ribityllumazine synthase [Flavobacteriales bacterium]|nr:6,7-dimethyl-8-ribityllumazine synthase [Flavobacteriales bacterium]
MSSANQNLSDHNTEYIPSGKGMRIAFVVSEWNPKITGALLQGAIDTCVKHKVYEHDLDADMNAVVHYVPGTFELPMGAKMVRRSAIYDAIICIGCVIQGETKHFDFICSSVASGIQDVQLGNNTPTIFGVLTTNDLQQAIDRSGGKYGNKGDEAAITAIKMFDLENKLDL